MGVCGLSYTPQAVVGSASDVLGGEPPTLRDSDSFRGAVWLSIPNLDQHHLESTHRSAGDRVISENTLGTQKEPFLADARAVRGLWGPLGRQPPTSEVWFGGQLPVALSRTHRARLKDIYAWTRHTEGTADIQEETEDPDSPWLIPPNRQTNGHHVQRQSSQPGRFMKYSSSVISCGC